jgi:hypothetical protein
MEVLSEHHDACLAGHCGTARTLELVTQNYWFLGINAFVKDYVNSYFLCQQAKTPHHLCHRELASLPIPTTLWKGFTYDFITELPISCSKDSVFMFIN